MGICLWSLSQLTWWWSTEICTLILCLAALLEVLNISTNLLTGFLESLMYNIISSANEGNLPSFPIVSFQLPSPVSLP